MQTPVYTHDLLALLVECANHDATLPVIRPALVVLNPYSVQFRYPGDTATVAEAKEAVVTLRQVRKVLREKLGL